MTEGLKKSGGRNNKGLTTIRFRGGGHKRTYRIIDFKRNKFGIPATVASIEYDPNRSARIALLNYADGEKRYILAARRPGSGREANERPEPPTSWLATRCRWSNIPAGTDGTQHRTAARQRRPDGPFGGRRGATGFKRRRHRAAETAVRRNPASATGVLSDDRPGGNVDHENVSLGKAGRTRHLGRRPHNRGVTMNPIDHPHGGGEGRTSGGRHPVTPWGQPTRGFKTRNNKRTDRDIVTRRPTRNK